LRYAHVVGGVRFVAAHAAVGIRRDTSPAESGSTLSGGSAASDQVTLFDFRSLMQV
jgi:hypothetical protein